MGDARTDYTAYLAENAQAYPPGWPAFAKRMKRAQPWCGFCGVREKKIPMPGFTTQAVEVVLQVHHISPIHVDPTRALDPDNVIVLCPWDHFHEGHVGNFLDWDATIEVRADNNLRAINLGRALTGPTARDRRPIP